MAPVFDSITLYSLAVAFIAAASGSLHCVAMCGPMRLLTGNLPAERLLYQGGRLFGYLLLGASAGFLGASLPSWLLLPLLLLGISFVFVPMLKLPGWQKLRQFILQLSSGHPLLMGVSSALLPCGLLHAWLGVAALTNHPFSGALLLFVLWLGTLPALEFCSLFFRRWLNKFRAKSPRLVMSFLLVVALIPMVWRYSFFEKVEAAPYGPATAASCPMHKNK